MKPGMRRWLSAGATATLLIASIFTWVTVTHHASAASGVIGDANIESSTDSDGSGLAEAFQATASSTGSVSTLNVYVDSSSTAATLVAGIYADASGHPGTLLTQGSLANPVGGAWNAVAVPTVSLTSGTAYWLTLLGAASGGGTLAFRDNCCGGGSTSYTSSQANLSTLPATWSNGSKWSDGPASFYGGTASTPTPTPTPTPPPPSQAGQWSGVNSLPLVDIHSILMRNGNVLMMDGWQQPNQTVVFNPATQATIPANNGFGLDIFCSAHLNMPDGRVYVFGGADPSTQGISATTIFDPSTNTWTQGPSMHYGRWYPTATELGDGRVVVISGQNSSTTWADTPEIYDPVANSWTLLSKISTSQVHEPEYPLSYLLPSGDIFTIAPSVGKSFVLDPNAQTWTQAGGATLDNGSAAMYLPGKILYTGGGAPFNSTASAQANAEVIDLTSATPTWTTVAPMNYARYTHTLTVLPDGKVLAVGGSPDLEQTTITNGVLPAEEWDPTTNTWTTLASMQVPRTYHSTAILLPDGRVLIAGSGHSDDISGPGQYNDQFFSPPYLFSGYNGYTGSRPTISAAPNAITYGSTFSVTTPDAASIGSVSLVSLGADSHTLDFDQHFVPLSFATGSGALSVTAPASSNVAPPGYYMLFILNTSGVPSVAAIMHLGATPPTVTMTAPTNGATVSGSAVTVSASVSSSVPVKNVQFQLDGNPLGAPVTQSPYTMTWDSTAVANGSHTLSAVVTDTEGDTATASPVTVTVSNAPPSGPTVDGSNSVQGMGAVTATLNTTGSGDLVLAFVSSDGPGTAQSDTVSGGGLTWTLVKRSNGQPGDAEIWSARASGVLSGAQITATPAQGGYNNSLTVVAFAHAAGVGASAGKSAASGAPSLSLTTTAANSVVYGVGHDYDNAIARTLGSGQTLVFQWLETTAGDTYWVQRITAYTGGAGSTATINDTAPTGDDWNLSIVEVTAG